MYSKGKGDSGILILVYVDDMLIISKSQRLIEETKSRIADMYETKDLGEAKHVLGVEMIRNDSGILLTQRRYIDEVLRRFNMQEANVTRTPVDPSNDEIHRKGVKNETGNEGRPTFPYSELVGCLMFLATRTRPDIAFAVGVLSQHMANPRKDHWTSLKRVLRYLKGTSSLGLCLKGGRILQAYTDADWAGDKQERKSRSGMSIYLGEDLVSWKSSQQKCVALSSSEAEFIALHSAATETIWLRKVLHELGSPQDDPTALYADNNGALAWAGDNASRKRAKHIDIRWNYTNTLVDAGEIAPTKIPSGENKADIHTKALSKAPFELRRHWLSLRSIEEEC